MPQLKQAFAYLDENTVGTIKHTAEPGTDTESFRQECSSNPKVQFKRSRNQSVKPLKREWWHNILKQDASLLIHKHTHDMMTRKNITHDMPEHYREHQPAIFSEKTVNKNLKDTVVLNGSEMKPAKEICRDPLRQK